MISIEHIKDNILKITPPEKLKAADFDQITAQVNALIDKYGSIRLLVDACAFSGWENTAAFDRHMAFVKNHHRKVARLALVAARDWQRWLAGAIRLFIHPEVRLYEKGMEKEALQWLEAD